MFDRLAKSVLGSVVFAGSLLLAPAALAGDHGRSKPGVDIDSLHAEIFSDGNDWLVKVR